MVGTRREKNRSKMKRYRKEAYSPQKQKIRRQDRERKHIERHGGVVLRKSPAYRKVLEASKAIRAILGDSPQKYAHVLAHVLHHGLKSPRKRQRLSEIQCFSTPPNNSSVERIGLKSPPSEDQKEITKLIQKLCVHRTKGKQKEARAIVDNFVEKDWAKCCTYC